MVSSLHNPTDNAFGFRRHSFVMTLLLVFPFIGSAEEKTSVDELQFFKQNVVPLLKKKCYSCHSHQSGKAKGGLMLDSRNGWVKGGASGPAIIPGNVNDSLLVQAIRYDGFEMPPEEPLTENEIDILERWIQSGAVDDRKSQAANSDREALWALEPIGKPVLPETINKEWARDPLDRFVLKRLEDAGLQPAVEADKYTLLRRVTFDLTGLPPTPEEIAVFVKDESPNAYEKVVTRLLASNAFGDHWARHWFDLSCYADVQRNTLIGEAWRYRDYVIKAFNDDKPIDRFIHEQIAGDHLPFESISQQRELIVATGYLSIGPWVIENYIKPQLAADIVDHQIDRIGRTFLGQTISCARCHDHKFDPITTKDYYALAGIFHSTATTAHTGPGVWSSILERKLPPLSENQEARLLALKRRDQILSELEVLQASLLKWFVKFPTATNANALVSRNAVIPNRKGVEYSLELEIGPTVWAAASQATMDGDAIRIDLIDTSGSSVHSFTVLSGAWSKQNDSQQFRKRSYEFSGGASDALRIRISTAHPGNQRFAGAVDNLRIIGNGETVFEDDFNTVAAAPLKGKQAHTDLELLARATLNDWESSGINSSHLVHRTNGNYALQIFSGSLASFGKVEEAEGPDATKLKEVRELEAQIGRLSLELESLSLQESPEYALAITDIESPEDVAIYRRGDFNLLGDITPRGTLSTVGTGVGVEVSDSTSGRLQLANWLTAPNNTLTSRVLANRIWHHIFGTGIVSTVDYFGVHGERPSHPKLLDYLAVCFQEQNRWSLKSTIQQLVLSSTYRMSSASNSKAIGIDPDNRLLWRMHRRRLSGEAIRDGMLMISGELDNARGGSSLGLELQGNIRGAGGDVNPATWGGIVPDYIKNRRAVYQPLKRERPVGDLEILTVFDFPHPNDITGARAQTTVATQALFLLNSSFVKSQATAINERLYAEQPAHEVKRIERLYMLVLNRLPSPSELEITQRFLDTVAGSAIDTKGHATARKLAWEQLCHGLLVSNGFLFKE